MAVKRRYWNVYRRVASYQYYDEDGNPMRTPWKWRGKTIAVSAEQAVYKVGTRPTEKGGAERLWFDGPAKHRWEEWTAVPTRITLDDPDWNNEPPFRLDCGYWGYWDDNLEC